jgi:hypothetical protein
MNELIQLLRQLEVAHFFGSIELKLEAGKVVLIRKSETFKPTQTGCGDNRGIHDRHQSR